jgi:hypothetical protein
MRFHTNCVGITHSYETHIPILVLLLSLSISGFVVLGTFDLVVTKPVETESENGNSASHVSNCGDTVLDFADAIHNSTGTCDIWLN